MNPFENPPVGDPVAVGDPVNVPGPSGPRRGRMALVALLSAGLLGGGIVGVSQFASADRPEVATAPPTTVAESDDETTDEQPTDDQPTDEQPSDDQPGDSDEAPPAPDADGEIVFDFGEGDPIVIDLGDFDGETVERLRECVGFPAIEFGEFEMPPFFDDEGFPGDDFFDEFFEDLDDLDGEFEFGEFGPFGSFEVGEGLDGSVTVLGPDGVSVIDLGESGSVTITKEDGEITINTEGDATVDSLDEMLGAIEFGEFDVGEFEPGQLGDLDLDELFESFPTFDELPRFEPIDPEAVQSCIDEVLGN